jgi:glycerophosphoryl diester phosphodiesterase
MKTQIVYHRGACRHAPENTIASGLAAARLGGDIVELDVRQSRGGVLYVLHDAKVDRATNGTGAIAQMTSADLDRLDVGEWFGLAFTGERLPRQGRNWCCPMGRGSPVRRGYKLMAR